MVEYLVALDFDKTEPARSEPAATGLGRTAARSDLVTARRFTALGKLAARVIHDLRNPLCVIKFACANLRRVVREPLAERSIANIEKKVLESEAILGQLLDYAKLRRPRKRMLDLVRLAAESVREARERRPGVDIAFATPRRRPPSGFGDRVQLKEVLDNLLGNACEALPAAGGRVEVTVRPGRGGVSIAVRDNGEGIAPDDLKRVFEPFFSKKPGGTGLGLGICREILEWHGGRISISSRPGRGTTVTVVVPADGGRA